MKINVTDVRRTHTVVSYHNGERNEHIVTGDARTVSVGLEPGEVADIMSNSERRNDTLLRPDLAELRWQRHTHWAYGLWGNQSWNFNAGRGDTWMLEVARIAGPNVRKDGSTGEQNRAAFHRWECHTRAPLDQMPDWFVELIAQHDPAVHGSPLDNEPVRNGE